MSASVTICPRAPQVPSGTSGVNTHTRPGSRSWAPASASGGSAPAGMYASSMGIRQASFRPQPDSRLRQESDHNIGCSSYASDTLCAMKRSALRHHHCSIARTLDVAGEWWTPLILRDVAYGVRRFRAIQEDLGISANILADRLDALLADGILETVLYQERPRRHEYRLTQKGAELLPALLALMQWGDRWMWPRGEGPVRVVHDDCDHDVRVEIHCAHCEREAAVHELRAKARWPLEDASSLPTPGNVSGRRLYSDGAGVRLDA